MLSETVITNTLFVYANFQLSQRAKSRLLTLDKNRCHPKSLQLSCVHQLDSARITSALLLVNSAITLCICITTEEIVLEKPNWEDPYLKDQSTCGDAVISLISCFTTAAGHGGLLSAVCHLGNHWASLHPSFHICALKIIINIFRAVIEIKEVVVCQLEFHYLGLQQHVPHPCQIPVATSIFPACFSGLHFPFHSLLLIPPFSNDHGEGNRNTW